jgi:hypothetical protein
MTTILGTPITMIEMVGLGVGLWAIWLAFRHAHDLKNLVGEMQRQAGEMHRQAEESRQAFIEMQGSISTRYISHFPFYFKDIVALLDKAQARIDIFCDLPAYGNFSSHQQFLDYKHKLENKLGQRDKQGRRLTIEMTCLSKEGRSALFEKQFGQEADWEKKKHSDDFRPLLVDFLEDHQRLSELESLSRDNFSGMLEEEDKLMLSKVLSRAKIFETRAHVPIYFWLIDESEAIFAIPCLSEKELEHGFSTTDSNLIRSFIEMRKGYNSPRDLPAVAPAARPSA